MGHGGQSVVGVVGRESEPSGGNGIMTGCLARELAVFPPRVSRRDPFPGTVARVTGEDVPMPYAKNLEELVILSVTKVIEAVHGVVYRE